MANRTLDANAGIAAPVPMRLGERVYDAAENVHTLRNRVVALHERLFGLAPMGVSVDGA